MKRLLFAVTIALVALSLNSAPVAAQATGATDVDITLPDIVILHYFSNVDLAISSNALGSFLTGGSGPSVDEGTATGSGGFTFDLNINPDGLTGDPSNVTLVLQNAWAVRSLSLLGGTNTELAVTVTDDTLNHSSTTATMEITAAIVDDGANSGATIEFPATGLYNPRVGAVHLTLDLTDSLQAGEYTNGEFTLTATNV